MSGHLETKRLTLHLRSPVHIGARVREFTPMEAVPFGGRIYVVQEDRLGRFLGEHHLLDAFVSAVTQEGERFDLRSFLEQRRLLSRETLEAVASFSARAPEGIPHVRQAAFRPLIRGGLGQAYVPGSSIKGALRGALLNRRIAGMGEAGRKQIAQAVERQIRERAKRTEFDRPVIGRLLRGQLPSGPAGRRKAAAPNLDLLRCLKVSDAVYEGDTVVLPVEVLSLRRGDDTFYLKGQMLLECIPEGAALTCTLTLDHGLLGEFGRGGTSLPFRSLDELLTQAEEHAEEVLDDEHYFFQGLQGAEALLEFYDMTDANLRIGYGSGLPATSILLNLPEEQRFRLRDTVLRARRDSLLFPKSRKVVMHHGRPVAPLGWVRWEVAE